MLKFRTILKYTYGVPYTYNYDLGSKEWIREDGLVRFNTLSIIRLINEHRIKILEQNFNISLIDHGNALTDAILISRLCKIV